MLAVLVLIPGTASDETLDLRRHFFASSRLFFSLGAVLLVQLAVVDSVVGEQAFFGSENLFRLPGVLVAGVAASSTDERLHTALAIVSGLLMVGFLVLGSGH